MTPYTGISDAELAVRAAADDQRAITTIFQKYAGKMLAVCMRYAFDRKEAEDVLQEGFITVFNKISQYKAEGSLEGWIRAIMVRRSLRFWKKRQTMLSEPIDNFHLEADTCSAIEDMQLKDLLKLINRLPEGYRIVFNLNVIDGYNHAEIAAMLGINESTSRSQLSKARMHLQKMILAFENYNSPSILNRDEKDGRGTI